jgi:hypothetical protein
MAMPQACDKPAGSRLAGLKVVREFKALMMPICAPGAPTWSPDETIAIGRSLDRGYDDALAPLDE